MTQEAQHLSEDLLWALVKNKQALNSNHIQHTQECRDCREFVQAFREDAQAQGFAVSNLG